MSIESELARIQQAKAAIIEVIVAKGGTVEGIPPIEDLANCIKSIPVGPGPEPTPYNVIGGREYKTVIMPDGKEWLAENLDYNFDGLSINPSDILTTPAAWYYDKDKETYGIDGIYKCGLLYNAYAVDYLNTNKDILLPEGWRVPTDDDWTVLANTIGNGTAGTVLRAVNNSINDNWPTGWNGTNNYGFNVLPAGLYSADDNIFKRINERAQFWTSTDAGIATPSNFSYYFLSTRKYISRTQTQKKTGYSVRLIRDI